MISNVPVEFSQTISKFKIWMIALFPLWVITQIILEIKHQCAYYFKARSSFEKDINKKGFAILSNFFTKEDINRISQLCDSVDKNKYKVLSIDGAFRIKGLEEISELKNLLNISKFERICSQSINLNNSDVTIMYSETSAIGQDAVFALHPHFDTYKHQLKVAIPLMDISTTNGPTEILVNSSKIHIKLLKFYFFSFLSLNKLIKNYKPIWDESYFTKFSNKVLLTGKTGDCLLFDSRSLHRATLPIHGQRRLLWIYLS